MWRKTLLIVSLTALFQGCENPIVTQAPKAGETGGTRSQQPADESRLVFSPNPISFGKVLVGNSKSMIVTVTNDGTIDAGSIYGDISAPFSFTGGSYPGTSGTCTTTLDPNQSCTIDVTFSPTSLTTYNEVLGLVYDDNFGDRYTLMPTQICVIYFANYRTLIFAMRW